MKILILCLVSTACFGQQFTLQDGTKIFIPEEFWKNALHINVSTPKEIQFAPGTQVKFIILEVPNGGKTIWIGDKVDKPTDPGPTVPVLKEHVNDQDARIVYDPGWQKVPANPAARWLDKFHNKDVTLQYNAGVWASFKFRGRRAELIAEVCDNHPKAKVEVLKGTTVIKSEVIDMYKNTGGSAADHCPAGVVTTLFSSGDLPLDDYTIRWSLESKDMTKVPARDSFVFDGIRVFE